MLVIHFGAIADDLSTQIEDAVGYRAKKGSTRALAKLNKLALDLCILHIADILTDSEVKKARKRLLKKICAQVEVEET